MRVALITNGISSNVHSSLELARRLSERGHTVSFLSHTDIAEAVQANGFGFHRLTADSRAFAELRALGRQLRSGSVRSRLAAACRLPVAAWRVRRSTVRAEELVDLLLRLDPGLLLIDLEAHVAIIGSCRLGIPTVLTTALFTMEERPGVPPISSSARPHETARIAADWAAVHRAAADAQRRRRRSRLALVDRLGPVSYATTSRDALRSVARHSGFDFASMTDTARGCDRTATAVCRCSPQTCANSSSVTAPRPTGTTSGRWCTPVDSTLLRRGSRHGVSCSVEAPGKRVRGHAGRSSTARWAALGRGPPDPPRRHRGGRQAAGVGSRHRPRGSRRPCRVG